MDRLQEVKKLFDKALAKAKEDCRIAMEELKRPLTTEEKIEEENGL